MSRPERWDAARTRALLRVPDATSDKYRRGVLAVRTGSAAYPGAAVLGVEAAWRSGAGMVRYVPPLGDAASMPGLPAPAAAVLAVRPETVFLDGREAMRRRSDAWLIGSGTDPAQRSFAEREAIRVILCGTAPVVADAGALPELAEPSVSEARRALPRPTPLAITPHRGEFLRLCSSLGLDGPWDGWERDASSGPSDEEVAEAALELARRLQAAVLLKGSVSAIATAGGFCALAGPATPWLATAGTGDVLAGILGALAAAHAAELRDDPELFGPLAASAAVLHDAAARVAVTRAAAHGDAASGPQQAPVTALDVAGAIPAAIAGMLR